MNEKRIIAKIVTSYKIVLTEELVNNARKDFLRNLRKFADLHQSYADYKTYRADVAAYNQRITSFFYDWILNDHMKALSSNGYSNDKLNYYSNELQKSAWMIHIYLDFRDLESITNPEEFQKKKQQLIGKIQRYARLAFSDAMDVVKFNPDVANKELSFAEEVDMGECYLIPEKGATVDQMEKAKKTVYEAVKIMKAAGMTKGFTPKMIIRVSSREDGTYLTSALYNYNTGEMTINPLGHTSPSTFIHEMGHHYYYRVFNQGRRDYWDAAFDGDLIKLTEEDFDQVLDIARKLDGDIDDRAFIELALEHWVKQHSDDLVIQAKARYMADHLLGIWGQRGKAPETFAKVKDNWMNWFGKPVMKNFVSDYGNTNAQEAFAEAFMHYVMRKPMNPVVKQWMDNLLR